MNLRPLFLFTVSAFAFSGIASAQNMCVQIIQAAVSPNGVCEEFATPCNVPADWKSVPSCDLINQEASAEISLEAKMNGRIAKMRAIWAMRKAAAGKKNTNKNFNRIGSGALTRSNLTTKRLPTSNGESTKRIRAFTDKDYTSDVAERYSRRGGYERAGETTSAERSKRRMARPSFRSRSDANRSGDLNTTVKWKVLGRQFTTKKNYGRNPYTSRSPYLKAQKAKRDAHNKEVDVQERLRSRQRTYRGARLDGNLDGSSLLEKGLINTGKSEEDAE